MEAVIEEQDAGSSHEDANVKGSVSLDSPIVHKFCALDYT